MFALKKEFALKKSLPSKKTHLDVLGLHALEHAGDMDGGVGQLLNAHNALEHRVRVALLTGVLHAAVVVHHSWAVQKIDVLGEGDVPAVLFQFCFVR